MPNFHNLTPPPHVLWDPDPQAAVGARTRHPFAIDHGGDEFIRQHLLKKGVPLEEVLMLDQDRASLL